MTSNNGRHETPNTSCMFYTAENFCWLCVFASLR